MADKRAEAMWKLYCEGKSAVQIGEIYSLSAKRVWGILSEAGYVMKGNYRTEEWKQQRQARSEGGENDVE